MSRVRAAAVCGIAAFATSLLLARAHPFGDAGLYAESRNVPVSQDAAFPLPVRETLAAHCADCHSTGTRAPFYARVAPFSWLVEHDILEARKAMDLSQWTNYSAEDQDALKSRMVLEVKARRMPLPRYRMIHWKARMTDADINVLSEWAHASSAFAAAQQSAAPAGDGDAARGKAVFERRCTGCHSLDQNREGPHLRGVYGRVSGSVPDFSYSTAIKQAHITWDETSLERWLTDPDTLIPGNNMDFHVANPQERRDLVRFLKESGAK